MEKNIKHALIIGDSWATFTPWLKEINYLGCFHGDDLPLFPEFQLLKYNFHVKNTGLGGGSNRHSLDQCEMQNLIYKKFDKSFDLIIWYHTELLRDWGRPGLVPLEEMKHLGLDNYLDKLAIETYSRAKKIKKQFPDSTWIIIGGHCPIRPSFRYLLEWADLIIDNWRQELSGVECPECHTLSFINEFELYKDLFPVDIVERELDKREKIISACDNCKIFYDKVHPSPRSQGLLSEKIISFLEKNNKL